MAVAGVGASSPWRAVLPVLSSPVTIVAAAVLVWNDHVGKTLYPGVVTGKLSDAAGLVVFPLLAAVVLSPVLGARLGLAATGRLALLLTGVGFCAAKTMPAAAAAWSALLSAIAGPSWLIADPTDLLVLPVLIIPWQMWERQQASARTAGSARRLGALMMLPVLAVATAATSCGIPTSVRSVVWDGEALIADGTERLWASFDGGRTWQRQQAEVEPSEPQPPHHDGTPSTPRVACAPEEKQRCYRANGGPLVEVSEDGGSTWRVAWQIVGHRRAAVNRGMSQGLCNGPPDITANDVVVVSHDAGHTVVVAMGEYGVLLGDGEGGWRAVAVGDARPYEPQDALLMLGREALMTGMFGWLLVLGRLRSFGRRLGPAWSSRRGRRRAAVAYALGTAVIALPPLWLMAVVPGLGYGIAAALALGAWLAWDVAVRAAPDSRTARTSRNRAFARGAGGWLLTLAPFVAWAVFGVPAPYWAAVVAALVFGVLVLAGGRAGGREPKV